MSYDLARLRKIAENVSGNEILDIGYAALPNPYLSGYYCVGYDLSSPRKISGYAKEIQGNVDEIDEKLRGHKYDTIILGELLEHLENPYKLLRDLHPLLKGDKKVIISTPIPLGFPVFFCELFNVKRYYYTEEHKYYFLPRWAERLIRSSQYEIKKIVPVGLETPYFCLPCPQMLSYQLIYVCQSMKTS